MRTRIGSRGQCRAQPEEMYELRREVLGKGGVSYVRKHKGFVDRGKRLADRNRRRWEHVGRSLVRFTFLLKYAVTSS